MSLEKVLEKLAVIDKKLESFEELKHIILRSGKCFNSELQLACEHTKDTTSAPTQSESSTSTSTDDANNSKTEENKVEKGEEPEKEVIDDTEDIYEPKDIDVSMSLSDETSQVDEDITEMQAVIEEEEEEEEEEDDDEEDEEEEDQTFDDIDDENDDYEDNEDSENTGSYLSARADTVRKDWEDMAIKLAKCDKKVAGNSLLHVIQTMNAKSNFDKLHTSPRNLTDEDTSADFSFESNTDFSDSMLGVYPLNYTDTDTEDDEEPTAEEVFATHPQFDLYDENEDEDLIEDTPIKRRFEFDETAEFFSTMNVSGTLNSEFGTEVALVEDEAEITDN